MITNCQVEYDTYQMDIIGHSQPRMMQGAGRLTVEMALPASLYDVVSAAVSMGEAEGLRYIADAIEVLSGPPVGVEDISPDLSNIQDPLGDPPARQERVRSINLPEPEPATTRRKSTGKRALEID